jgi:hypothetical protein
VARYGPDDVSVTYSSQALDDVTVIGDISKEAILEEITPFGSAWETHAPVGVSRFSEIILEAPYTDDANDLTDKGDDVGLGGTATLVIVFGGTKQVSISTVLRQIVRTIGRGALTRSRLVLQPTGAPTEA